MTTPRVRHAARRRGSCVAARGAGAAARETADHRVLGRQFAFGSKPMDRSFVQRLGELGWIEGRNVAIEYRWAETHFERSPELIAEFVRLRVDVIVTHATANILAAKQGTSMIPIVFAAVADPVSIGVVDNLARPGGNITGLSNQFTAVAGKRVELLREVVPGLRRLAILANVGIANAVLEIDQVEAAARTACGRRAAGGYG